MPLKYAFCGKIPHLKDLTDGKVENSIGVIKVERARRSKNPTAIALVVSISAIVALCAKANHARRCALPGKQTSDTNKPPSAASKQLAGSLSNKAITFVYKTKLQGIEVEEGFGEGGVWQRSILMGEKCQPPEFSGVIYCDECGIQLSELPPRSPRVASPLPSFFSPVARDMQPC
ncbi:hypothetical protein ACFX13_021122 [Malus domestica]